MLKVLILNQLRMSQSSPFPHWLAIVPCHPREECDRETSFSWRTGPALPEQSVPTWRLQNNYPPQHRYQHIHAHDQRKTSTLRNETVIMSRKWVCIPWSEVYVFRFNTLLWTLSGNTIISEKTCRERALNTFAVCPGCCGYRAEPCNRVQEQPAHAYPCRGHCDDLQRLWPLCLLVSCSRESPPFKWQTPDGFRRTIFCSVSEPQGRFLSLIPGSVISSLGIRGGLLGANSRPVFQTCAYHTSSSGHVFCIGSHQDFKDSLLSSD